MDSRITPVALTVIVLVSVASGALIARWLLARRAADLRVTDRESGEPLFI